MTGWDGERLFFRLFWPRKRQQKMFGASSASKRSGYCIAGRGTGKLD